MRLFLMVLMIFPFVGLSQMKFSKTKHSFGDLYENAPTYVDFEFTNESDVPIFLLTIDKPREVNYIYSTKIVKPDSTLIIRLKINDRITGRFNYRIDTYFSSSNEPISLYLTGNVKEKSTNSLTECPDFSKTPPAGQMAEFEITIKVIDSLTHEPIRKSKVYLVKDGELVGEHYTNSDGIIHKKLPLGLYYITAQHKDYYSNYHEGYLNFQSNYVEIELQQPFVEEPIITKPVNNPVLIVTEPVKDPVLIDTIVVEEPIVEPPVVAEVSETPPEGFKSGDYVPNNIVFIVDVSSSMNGMGKLDLLKMSMIELTKLLRKEDRVSLIAYSGSVRILLENISGMQKEEIIAQVKTLVAKGYTNGGEAIAEGYRLVQKSLIKGGNNLIFMVTDGAFNKGQQDYKKTIKKNYKELDVKFTVVGIKTLDYLALNMNSMASLGGGKYIRIVTVDDAQNKLFDEIKRTSYKPR